MQFVRYVLVQVITYGVDMGGFILLFSCFGVGPLLANMVSKVLSGFLAFVVHRSFTFGVAEAGIKVQQAVRYFALLTLNIPLSAQVLGIMLWVIPMAVAAKLVADMICVFLTYWLSKRFVFLGSDAVKSSVGNGRGEL